MKTIENCQVKDEIDFDTRVTDINKSQTFKTLLNHWLDCETGDAVHKQLDLFVQHENEVFELGTNVKQ